MPRRKAPRSRARADSAAKVACALDVGDDAQPPSGGAGNAAGRLCGNLGAFALDLVTPAWLLDALVDFHAAGAEQGVARGAPKTRASGTAVRAPRAGGRRA